jgi:hypothetical protein
MSERPRLESAGAAFTLLASVAFIASFAFGLGRASERTADTVLEPGIQVLDPPPPAGRVEVLNASGRSGMARAATQQLRAAGFDVVFFGNAPASAGDSTIVLDRIGDDAVARAVAAHLGIVRVATLRDTALYLEATVILGRDWDGR